MRISDVVSSLSRVQTLDPRSMHAVNDARLVLVNMHNDNIKLEDRINELTARIADLEAEVARCREALFSVTDFSNDPAVIRIARNALKEG